MNVDQRTLVELGVLPRSERQWPLRPLLDRTHSPRALTQLKRLVAMPLGDAESIRKRQRALRELPRALNSLRWDECMRDCEVVERYLSVNYVLVPTRRLAAFVFGRRNPDIALDVSNWMRVLARHVQRCSSVFVQLHHLQGDDPLLADILSALQKIDESPLASQLLIATNSMNTLRRRLGELDELARREWRQAVEESISAMHQLNALWSMAGLTTTPGFVYPEISEDPFCTLLLEGAWHPLLERGTPNDVLLNQDERVVFITGPNMAGKSTLLRTVGIIFHFAHLGLPVPATRARLPRVQRLITALTAEDNIVKRESLYLAEVRRVRAIVEAIANGETVVTLIDEAFRGTNVKDAADATGLLVDGISRAHTGIFLIASHLVEVAAARRDHPRMGMWYMHVDGNDTSSGFTYSLRRGVSEVRLGVRLLEREGVVDLLENIGAPEPAGTPL